MLKDMFKDILKHKDKIRRMLLHIALICGIVILTAGILDWYNPYMNFSGQIRPLEVLQVCDLLFLALTADLPDIGKSRGNLLNFRTRGRQSGAKGCARPLSAGKKHVIGSSVHPVTAVKSCGNGPDSPIPAEKVYSDGSGHPAAASKKSKARARRRGRLR